MIIASLLSDCAHTYKFFENGVANEAIVLQWLVQTTSSDFKIVKKQWAGALLSVKCCCFVHNPSWKSHLWTSLSEEDKEEEEEEEEKERRRRNIVFHATKHVVDHEALENEWYIVIKAYKFIVFEILRFFCIIIYCVSALRAKLLHAISYHNNVLLQWSYCMIFRMAIDIAIVIYHSIPQYIAVKALPSPYILA